MRAFPVVFSGVLASAGALAFAFGGGGGADPLEPPPPANTEFACVLLRVGLGADTLAAAGISGQQVTALVAGLRQGYNAATLATKDEAYITAKQTHDRLRRLVTSGKGSQEDVAALRTAETALAAANTQRETYLSGLRTAGLATVSEGQRTLANRIRTNGSWHFPAQYLVKDRTEAQWVELRDLLAAKDIHARDATAPFPAEVQSRLAALDAEGEVATAKVNLDAGMASVQTAWNAAEIPEETWWGPRQMLPTPDPMPHGPAACAVPRELPPLVGVEACTAPGSCSRLGPFRPDRTGYLASLIATSLVLLGSRSKEPVAIPPSSATLQR